MNLHELLADEAFDLPVPPDAVAEVRRRSSRTRRRRAAVLAAPALAAAIAVGAVVLSGGPSSTALYGTDPSPSPTPSTAPPQRPEASVQMVCVEQDPGGVRDDPSAGTLDARLLTGDPVADCARRGARNGFEAQLTAYHDGRATLTVVPSSWRLPPPYRALPAGFRADEARVAANLMFEDPIDGPTFGARRCLTDPQASAIARSILTRAGLDYELQRDPSTPVGDGRTVCGWVSFPREDSPVVVLRGYELQAEEAPPSARSRFYERLRTRFAQRCLSVVKAEQEVRDAGRAFGLREGTDYDLLRTEVAGGRCTSIDAQDGPGPFPVVLRHT